MSNDRFDYPLDLGLVKTSQCDSIWRDEINRHDGLIAIIKTFEPYESNSRDHFQKRFGNCPDDKLLALAEELAPHVKENINDLQNRMINILKGWLAEKLASDSAQLLTGKDDIPPEIRKVLEKLRT